MSITDLPFDRGSRIYRVFERLGLHCQGLSDKNHHILIDPNNPYLFLSIPNHPKVDRSTLKAEIRKWAKAKNIQDGDARFCEAYDELYGRAKKPTAEVVHELEMCSMCRELIKPEDETVVHQASGLKVHKSCHDKNRGDATATTAGS